MLEHPVPVLAPRGGVLPAERLALVAGQPDRQGRLDHRQLDLGGNQAAVELEGEEDGERLVVLRLRRQVFNNRLPADPEAAVRLVTRLDPAAGGRVARWLRDRARLDGLRARGAALLTGELQ